MASTTAAHRRAEARAGWLFSLPAVLLLTAFIVVPFVLAGYFSLTNRRLLSPLPTRFVGLGNFRDVLTDNRFHRALINNVIFVLVIVPLQTALALGLAMLVNTRLRGRVIFRTIYFMPVVTVMAAAATIWVLLLNPSGLVNAVLESVTFGAFRPDWLQSTTWALPAVMLVSIWQGTGFQMIILLAALQDVPPSLYEAAALDGASSWARFRYVTLPGIRNGLLFVVTVTTIFAFRLFDQVWLMPRTAGGPRNSTRTMMLELVETGFSRQQVGRGSAIALIFFAIVLGITIVQRLIIKEQQVET